MRKHDAGIALGVLGMLGLFGGVEYAGWVMFVGLVMSL